MTKMLQELKDFYNNKNVYITGITGFKGTWLALTLKQLGANVSGFGLQFPEDSLSNLINLDKHVNVKYIDIMNPESLHLIKSDILKFNPDVIIHLAAQPIVSEGYKKPFETYQTNIMGTVILHESARELNKKVSFINVTTDKVYAEGKRPRIEDDRLQGLDPYSMSKACSDMISQSYASSFDDSVIISTMRAGNVLGGGDFSKNRIITDYINSYVNSTPIELRHPESIRPYQFVLDAIMGYLIQGMKQYNNPDLAGAYNVGPKFSEKATTLEVIQKMNEYMDHSVDIGTNGRTIGHENPTLLLYSNKLRDVLNWIPYCDTFDKVIFNTAKWYNYFIKNTNSIDLLNFTNNQIKECLTSYDYND